jgi:hypothetical protein
MIGNTIPKPIMSIKTVPNKTDSKRFCMLFLSN